MTFLSFLKRGVGFIRRYSAHPRFMFAYGVHYPNSSFRACANFFSHEEVAKEIRRGRSIIRYGDGEMHMMNGGSIHYQKHERGLELSMREAAKNYSDTSPYIIGLPVFINRSNVELKKEGKFFVWMPSKVMYKILFPKNAHYADAHFFYYDGFFKKYLESYLMDKHLVVVSNEDNIRQFKDNKNIPFRNVSFVATPKKDSYSEYNRICRDVNSAIKNVPQGEKVVLLFSVGPTSKQLVYDFSRKGFQSLDIGRGLEVFYMDDSIEALFPELKDNRTS